MQENYHFNNMYGNSGNNGYSNMEMGYNPYNHSNMTGGNVTGMDMMDSSMMVPMDPYTGAPVAGGYYEDDYNNNMNNINNNHNNLATNMSSQYSEPNAPSMADQRTLSQLERGMSSNDLQRRKSFTGPQTEEDKAVALSHRTRSMSRVQSTRSVGQTEQSGLARTGSMFHSTRDRDTQVSISMRGGMGSNDVMEVEDLKQYYGDMAERQHCSTVNGMKSVKSYRGAIEEGEDVGRPRRVTTRRNVNGHSSTGYGGLSFKRAVAMAKGEQWGSAEIIKVNGPHNSTNSAPESSVQQPSQMASRAPYQINPYDQEMMRRQTELEALEMAAQAEQGVPHVYQQEEVRTYSNLSDMFEALRE